MPLILLALALGMAALFATGVLTGGGDKAAAVATAPPPASGSPPEVSPGPQLAGGLGASPRYRERFDAGAPSGEDESAVRDGRAFFDRDSRSRGGLRDAPAAPVLVDSAWDGGPARENLPLSRSRSLRISGPEPPAPGFGPIGGAGGPSALPGTAPAPNAPGPALAAFDRFQRAVYTTLSPLLSRVDWGARPRRGRAASQAPFRVTVHHTQAHRTDTRAQTVAEVRAIQRYHMAGRGREGKETFSDIGYHFLVDGAGNIVEGRQAEVLGAHAGSANDGNIGIALMGDFNRSRPTPAQLESLKRLATFLAIRYHRDPGQRGFLQGHNHFNHTDCPGANVTAMLDRLRSEIDAMTDRVLARQRGSPAPVQAAAVEDFYPLIVTRRA